MDALKRAYFSIVAGIAYLTRNKPALEKFNEYTTVKRVSREVNYYRSHFFNL